MNQGSFFESEDIEVGDAQLHSLQRELESAIDRAKQLTRSCKVGHYEQSQYQTDAMGQLILPEYKEHVNYNEQFWKKYLKNELNFAIIKQLSGKLGDLEKQLKEIEDLNQEYQKLFKIKNRKKNRRLASEIQKSFQCPYEQCYRYYGSDVSLNLHIKLKHKGGNKTDREHLAEEICLAEVQGKPMPQMTYNLPQGYLEEYRKKFQERDEGEGPLWQKKKSLLKLTQYRETH